MPPGLGHRAFAQIAKETIFGTFKDPLAKFEIISSAINPVIGTIRDPSLHSAVSRRALYQGGILYRGPLTVRLNFEGLLPLFEGVFGSATSTVEAGESVVRNHVFREFSTLPSYSIELNEGDPKSNGNVARYLGCKFAGVTIKGTAGQGDDGMLTAEFDVLAKDKDVNAGASNIGHPPGAYATVTGGGGAGGSPIITCGQDFIAAGVKPGTLVYGTGVGDNGTLVVTGGGGSGASKVVTMSNTAGVRAGQRVTGTGIGTNAIVSFVVNATTINVTVANSGAVSGSLTFTEGARVISITSATSLTVNVNNAGAVSGTLAFGLQFPALLPVLFHSDNIGSTINNGVLEDGTIRVRSFEVALENALADDRFYFGSTTIDEPIRNDFLTSRWTFEEEFQSWDSFARAKAFTDTTPKMILSASPTIGTGIRREFELRSKKAKYVEQGAPTEGYGIILQRTVQEAYHDTSDVSALYCRFRSLDGGVV